MGQGERWTPAQRAARLSKLVERNREHRGGDLLYEDPEWMRDAYIVRGLTLREVALEARCSLRTVARWMNAHGVPTNGVREVRRLRGADHPNWRGVTICPRCGGKKTSSSRTCGSCRDRTGAQNPRWKGDTVEYTAMHSRIVAARGRPETFRCSHCGGPAAEWAYDHADPAEQRNSQGRDDGPFSLDVEHYIPLCVRCHRRFDLGG